MNCHLSPIVYACVFNCLCLLSSSVVHLIEIVYKSTKYLLVNLLTAINGVESYF